MTPRLRIGYVYRDFNRNGSISSFYRARAERLAEDEDVIAVCSAETREPTTAPLRFETVEPLIRSRGRYGYAIECASFAFRAARSLRRLRAELDVVHVVGFDAPVADLVTVNAVRRAELDRYFAEFEPHAHVRRRFAPFLRPQSLVVLAVERRLFRRPYPYCIAQSQQVGHDLVQRYGVPPDAVEIIPASLDVGRFRFDAAARARVRARLHVPEDRLVMLFVGDEFERKGLDRTIRALAKVHADAELWVAGGDDAPPYESLATSLEIRGRVRFFGRVEADLLPELYSGCDALVLPSRQDAWGQPVIEALAAGRVVLVSEFAGAHEIIREGANGFVLAREGSPEQIAALLDGPAGRPGSRGPLGEAAVRTAAGFDHDALHSRLRDAHHKAYARRLRCLQEAAA